jgi:hypothetical protein
MPRLAQRIGGVEDNDVKRTGEVARLIVANPRAPSLGGEQPRMPRGEK